MGDKAYGMGDRVKLTIKEIKASEPESKLEVERVTNYINGFLFRPPSRYAIWILVRLGLTANQVSVLAFLSTVATCVLLGIGTYWWMIVGALMSFLELFLDFTDGGLARATDTTSKRGYYIDAMVGHFAALAIPASVGFGLWIQTGNSYFLLLGSILALLKAFRVLAATEFVVAYSDWTMGTIKPNRKNLLWLIYTVGTNTVNIWRFFLLGFAVLDRLDLFLYLYIVVTFLELTIALSLILVRTEFTAKGHTLKELKRVLKKSYIEDMLIFTMDDWNKSRVSLLCKIHKEFSGSKVVARSSSLSEDSLTRSKAGYYYSELDVNPEDINALAEAINRVIASYDKGKPEQILVQRQTEGVLISGVLFTSELSTNAPYYIINYSSGKRTDWITSGKDGKTLKVFKGTALSLLDQGWRELVEAVKEIESIIPNIPLDIEFAITNKGVVIFQVRPLAANVKS